MKTNKNSKFARAKKRVEDIKGFYKHLLVYLIINIALFIIRGNILDYLQDSNNEIDFITWVDWNILITPMLWGLALLIHGLHVFHRNIGFVKNWEERRIKKIMEKEDRNDNVQWD